MLEDFQLEYASGIPVYRQIINRVKTDIALGKAQADERLPTIRALTEQLEINPNTVAKAYRELELAGVIVSQRGNGSFVRACGTTDAPLTPEQKDAKLEALYGRMRTEAFRLGISEADLGEYMQRKGRS